MNGTSDRSHHDHERKDVDVMSLFIIVFMLLMSLVIILFVGGGLIHTLKLRERSTTAGDANVSATEAAQFPGPRLETKPGAGLAKLRAAEDADLNSYGWVDRATGTVRIPIDRAMHLILERGLPEVGAGKTPLSLMQARPTETASPPRLMPNQ